MNNKNYILIGLTGPTGAGKTSVTKILEAQGFGIVEADKIAHKALEDSDCIKALTNAFGEGILNTDGSINRRETAKVAFSSKENTEKLNSITHPVIEKLSLKAFDEYFCHGFDKIIFDAPTLFESGLHKICDKIIAVTADDNIRLERIMKRDGITEEEARRRMSAQKDCSYYKERAHISIDNSKDESALCAEVLEVAKELSL